MTRPTLTKDFLNTDLDVDVRFFAMAGVDTLGWVEQFGPDWRAFAFTAENSATHKSGQFLGWFRSRKAALSAIGC